MQDDIRFSFLGSCRAVVAIVGSFLCLFLIIWLTAPIILSNYLSNKTGLKVVVAQVDIFPRKIEIEHITLHNIPDSVLATAFSAESMILEAPLWNYYRRNVIIEKVTINDVYLGLEFSNPGDHKGNWAEILEKMQAATPTSIPLQDHLLAQTVLIRKLEFNHLNTEVAYKTSPDKLRRLETIEQLEFINVDSENGIGRGQFLKSILGEMLIAVFKKEGLKNIFSFLIPSAPFRAITPKKSEKTEETPSSSEATPSENATE